MTKIPELAKRDPRFQRAIRDAEIYKLRTEEKLTYQKIADRYGLTRQNILRIVKDYPVK